MDLFFFTLLNSNLCLLGFLECQELNIMPFYYIYLFLNLNLMLCQYFKTFPPFVEYQYSLPQLFVYLFIFSFFPMILLNLYTDNSVFHFYVFSHWIYQYMTCPVLFLVKKQNDVIIPRVECIICFQEHESFVQLPCGHEFHERCITRWFKTKSSVLHFTCPVCRKQIYTQV